MKYEVHVRPGRPEEEALVYKSWVGTYKSSLFAKGIPKGLYEARQTKVIRELLARGAQVLIAHAPEEPDTILGWAVVEGDLAGHPNILHYVFVKEPFRRLGIGSQLVRGLAGRFRFTHYHQSADAFVSTLRRAEGEAGGGIYDPYIALRLA